MSFVSKSKQILHELEVHSPFTLIGALTGIIFMLIGRKFLSGQEHTLFAIFHPLHVVLSAMVTAALFEIHRKAKSFILIMAVGIVGSIGIATLSDCILPFFGETILGVAVPRHDDLHDHADDDAALVRELEAEMDTGHEDEQGIEDSGDLSAIDDHQDDDHARLHLGFIEEWYLVFPAAFLGVLLAYFFPYTKYPHAAHVLFSTWASSSHMLMNTHADLTLLLWVGMFVVLFLAVWLPCCVSDIIFPLLFVRSDGAHVGHSCCVLCGKKEPKTENES